LLDFFLGTSGFMIWLFEVDPRFLGFFLIASGVYGVDLLLRFP
ncbi:10730_t:CDS:2, partial [Dentiscutata erythropus]